MIQKIHTLQKRLIQKTEEIVDKELLIQEKEKLYIELKHILARQPGPEAAEQLSIYQQTLKEKTKQMKVFLVTSFYFLLWFMWDSSYYHANIWWNFTNNILQTLDMVFNNTQIL